MSMLKQCQVVFRYYDCKLLSQHRDPSDKGHERGAESVNFPVPKSAKAGDWLGVFDLSEMKSCPANDAAIIQITTLATIVPAHFATS